METNFADIMSQRTTEELVKITGLNRATYQTAAIEAAEAELRRRNVAAGEVAELKDTQVRDAEKLRQVDTAAAGLGARFLHFMVDTIAWIVITAVLGYLLAPVLEEITSDLFGYAFVMATWFGYYLLMESMYQKTFGKMLTGTRVTMKDDRKPSTGDIFIRTVGRMIPFDHISFFFMPGGIHDYISQTTVVKG